MTATGPLVYRNFAWRIESLTPTSTTVSRKFKAAERPLGLYADQSSGTTRDFALYFDIGSPVAEPCGGDGRLRDYTFLLEVAYTTDLKLVDLNALVLSDSFDLVKLLRDDTKWSGYSAAASTTDLGIGKRHLVEERLDRSSPVTWYLRQLWRCSVWESE